jgi:hypothetical protein
MVLVEVVVKKMGYYYHFGVWKGNHMKSTGGIGLEDALPGLLLVALYKKRKLIGMIVIVRKLIVRVVIIT